MYSSCWSLVVYLHCWETDWVMILDSKVAWVKMSKYSSEIWKTKALHYFCSQNTPDTWRSNLSFSSLEKTFLCSLDNGPSLARHSRGGCAGLLRCGNQLPSFPYHLHQHIIISRQRNNLGRRNASSSCHLLPILHPTWNSWPTCRRIRLIHFMHFIFM